MIFDMYLPSFVKIDLKFKWFGYYRLKIKLFIIFIDDQLCITLKLWFIIGFVLKFIWSKVECATDVLMSLLFFLHVFFKSLHPMLQISVYFQISFYYSLHTINVLIHIIFFISKSLQIANQLTLLCQELSCFLKIL